MTYVNEKGKKVFDWESLGKQAGVCYSSVPARVTFLSGPLSSEVDTFRPKKKRRIMRRSQQLFESCAEVVAEEMEKERTTNTTKLSDAELHMKSLKKLLRAKCSAAAKRNGGPDAEDPDAIDNEIDMVPFLFNPNSFTQTIENILVRAL